MGSILPSVDSNYFYDKNETDVWNVFVTEQFNRLTDASHPIPILCSGSGCLYVCSVQVYGYDEVCVMFAAQLRWRGWMKGMIVHE